MWVVTALFVASQTADFIQIAVRYHTEMGWQDWLKGIGVIIRQVFFFALVFVGLGILIEMVDDIRWAVLSPEERLSRQTRPSLWRRIRRWPNE
jgi:hypothetical protein